MVATIKMSRKNLLQIDIHFNNIMKKNKHVHKKSKILMGNRKSIPP